jgi:NitT/TauT family transport system substrate-binding protein
MADQTIRVYVSTAQTIKAKRDLLVRFHRALANSVAFAYSNDQALEEYAKMAKVTPAIARRVRDEYHPLPNMQLKEVRKLDLSLKQALEFKFIDKAMKPDDLKPMIDILVP